ncbi:MAG TPA: hypothetical protein VK626_01525 [Nitrospiraceae bacterium]|nr:hypothetical protein [Nitrospiraceae bacterium]
MPAVYTGTHFVPILPTGLPIPGAKATFSISASATLQDTYTDQTLAVANTNPVVADANGVFPPIVLDPSLPNYRMTLTDANNVQKDQQDNIPSSQNTGQTFRLKSTAPFLLFEETDASAGNKKWRIRVNNEQLLIELLSDDESLSTTLLTLDRTGLTADTVLAGVVTGVFTGTLTGMTATVTGNVTYTIINNWCTLRGVFSGTSSTTGMTMTGLPAAVQPTGSAICVSCALTDNGANAGGWAKILASASTITFGKGIDNNAAGFTAAAGKGLASGWCIGYPLT